MNVMERDGNQSVLTELLDPAQVRIGSEPSEPGTKPTVDDR